MDICNTQTACMPHESLLHAMHGLQHLGELAEESVVNSKLVFDKINICYSCTIYIITQWYKPCILITASMLNHIDYGLYVYAW